VTASEAITKSRLHAYWKVMMMSAREDRANPLRIAGSVGLGVVRMILIAAIYKVAYELTHTTALPYENAIWSMGLYFAFIVGLSVRNVFRLIEKDVKDGNVEVSLIKPLDWRAVKICQQIGKNLLEFSVLVVAFFATLAIVVGFPDISHFSPVFIGGYLLIMLLAILSASAMFLMVGLTAFWLNDSQSVYRIVDRTIMVFGGSFVPIALLPGAVQDVLRYSPVGVYGASTQLFNPGLVKYLIPTLIASAAWSVVLLFFCQLVWRRAERRIEVNGG